MAATRTDRTEDDALVAASRAGDRAAFSALAEGYRRELRAHCYRMLGSLDDAEDLVQETFLRAWRSRETFKGQSSFRTWLYRIATNACLNVLTRGPRRVLPHQLAPPSDPDDPLGPPPEVLWLQPYPDRLLEPAAPGDSEPDAAAVARETIELAFLAAIQHLPPRQRAALLLRDVLGWSARETAELLDASVPAANSALQRARATLKQHLPRRRLEWARTTVPTEDERALLQRYIRAHEAGDAAGLAALLAEDARATMPPYPNWYVGRAAIQATLAESFDPAAAGYTGSWRILPTAANRLPAAASYVRQPGDTRYRAFGITVLRIERGEIVEITSFLNADLFGAFGLPAEL